LLEAPQLLEVVLRAEVLQAGTEVLRSGTEVLQGTPLLQDPLLQAGVRAEVLRSGTEVLQGTPLLQNPLLQAGLRTEVRLRSAQGLVLGE
jgi:hypothetical protein